LYIDAVVVAVADNYGGIFRGAYGFDGTHADSGRPHLGEQVGDGLGKATRIFRSVNKHTGKERWNRLMKKIK